MTATERITQEHYPATTFYDLIGRGWLMVCDCGWTSTLNRTLGSAGEEFDDHLKLTSAALSDQHGPQAAGRTNPKK